MVIAITPGKEFRHIPSSEYEKLTEAEIKADVKPHTLRKGATGFMLRPLTHTEQIELYSLEGGEELRLAQRVAYTLPRALMGFDPSMPLLDEDGSSVAFVVDDKLGGASEETLDRLAFITKVELAGVIVHGAALTDEVVEKSEPAQEG